MVNIMILQMLLMIKIASRTEILCGRRVPKEGYCIQQLSGEHAFWQSEPEQSAFKVVKTVHVAVFVLEIIEVLEPDVSRAALEIPSANCVMYVFWSAIALQLADTPASPEPLDKVTASLSSLKM